MPLRPLLLLTLAGLLAACAAEPPAPKQAPSQQPQTAMVVPLPAHLRELSGNLAGAPANSTVELALLVIDERDRPQRLLANIELQGSGALLPFRLRFNPESFPRGARVELRGRASQSGILTRRLPPLRIVAPTSQVLGTLHLVPAP
ncbi:hypothetical protein D3880_03015 [Pseudomonas cavernae]|uniref:Lipoprotein n=1 Tax=Pseudomonas cavernae TaxID=2320867 RepID=A0A385YY96_9PSED|nr:hypothetical protein [Pseudomonas cavernae]AYC31421.1 hypothetical protein D3880_03015 [Pseudomonas cavernae]